MFVLLFDRDVFKNIDLAVQHALFKRDIRGETFNKNDQSGNISVKWYDPNTTGW